MTSAPDAIAAIVSAACRRIRSPRSVVVVPLDADDRCSRRAQLRQVARLVLEARACG